jgi:hypothetical protein
MVIVPDLQSMFSQRNAKSSPRRKSVNKAIISSIQPGLWYAITAVI